MSILIWMLAFFSDYSDVSVNYNLMAFLCGKYESFSFGTVCIFRCYYDLDKKWTIENNSSQSRYKLLNS